MKKLAIYILFVLGTNYFSSCSVDEKTIETKKALTEDEFVSQLKFKPLTSSIDSRATGNPTISPKKRFLGIISAWIARKSKGCKSGFGLCDFKLFSSNSSISQLEASLEENEYLLEVELDETTNNYYVSLLLDQPLPEGATEEMVALKIEEDIYWLKDEDSITDLNTALDDSSNDNGNSEENDLTSKEFVKIDADTLLLNPTLGPNGGYQIALSTNWFYYEYQIVYESKITVRFNLMASNLL